MVKKSTSLDEIQKRLGDYRHIGLPKTKQKLRDLWIKPKEKTMREWLTEIEEAWNKKEILEARIEELSWVLSE